MPKNTIRFDENKWYTQGRALKAFAAAAVLGAGGWQFAKWWDNPIDHEAVKLASNHVIISDKKTSDPSSVIMSRQGGRDESKGRTREGTDQDVMQKDIEQGISAAKAILKSYDQFVQTNPRPHQKYEFLKRVMNNSVGTAHPESAVLDGDTTALFRLFRLAAQDAIADLRLQALHDPDFDYHPLMLAAAMDCFNTAMDPQAEICKNLMMGAQREISEQRWAKRPYTPE